MGDVYIDEIGDKIADYSLLDMTDLTAGTYHVRRTINAACLFLLLLCGKHKWLVSFEIDLQ